MPKRRIVEEDSSDEEENYYKKTSGNDKTLIRSMLEQFYLDPFTQRTVNPHEACIGPDNQYYQRDAIQEYILHSSGNFKSLSRSIPDVECKDFHCLRPVPHIMAEIYDEHVAYDIELEPFNIEDQQEAERVYLRNIDSSYMRKFFEDIQHEALANLSCLSLTNCDIRNLGFLRKRPNLKELEIVQSEWGVVVAFLSSIRSLRKLVLSHIHHGHRPEASTLKNAFHLENLEVLRIKNSHVRHKLMQPFFNFSDRSAFPLQELYLDSVTSDDAAIILAGSTSHHRSLFPSLHSVSIRNMKIAKESIPFVGQLVTPNLENLDLSHVAGDNEDEIRIIKPILEAATSVTALTLTGNRIVQEDMESLLSLSQRMANDTLVSICLDDIVIESDVLSSLFQNFIFSSVQKLYMSNIQMGNSGLKIFARECHKLEDLKVLHLQKNHIGDEGIIAFAKEFHKMKNLENILLHTNDIGDDGAIAFSRAFYMHPLPLKQYSLQGNSISFRGLLSLSRAPNSLLDVYFSRSSFDHSQMSDIRIAFKPVEVHFDENDH